MDRFCITQKSPTQKSANAKFAKKKFVIERNRRDNVTTKITSRLPENIKRDVPSLKDDKYWKR